VPASRRRSLPRMAIERRPLGRTGTEVTIPGYGAGDLYAEALSRLTALAGR